MDPDFVFRIYLKNTSTSMSGGDVITSSKDKDVNDVSPETNDLTSVVTIKVQMFGHSEEEGELYFSKLFSMFKLLFQCIMTEA
ncbi:hypothetical protein DPMN_016523 [Dreissena polymorpha]|uniref:Uncharacterized protein n=1 Tax=Dreissena polymorpha TaxID=45954 RepID=A0A9D4NDP2_DREPO|nr:hypothetical protein DPMN_016523 [Dreissena polymorpha]